MGLAATFNETAAGSWTEGLRAAPRATSMELASAPFTPKAAF